MRFSHYRTKAGALLIALAVIGVIPAIGSASGSNTGPHSSDIEVSKTAVTAETVGASTTITWKVVVTNDGGRDLEEVKLIDPGVDFGTPVSSFDDHCTAKPSVGDKSDNDHNNVSTCVDDPTVLQEHESLSYTGTQSMAKVCGWVKNTVVVTAEDRISGRVYGRQKPTLEARATAKIFVECADFDVTKVAKERSYNLGQTITWIVTVKNTGNVALSNPVLDDPGVTFGPPTSSMPAGSAKHAKSLRTARGVKKMPKSSSRCEKKNSSKSQRSVKDSCKKDDDPDCDDDDKGYSAKSGSKDDDCAKDDGVLNPGETLTFVGTQTANACGVVTNTVTVKVVSRPGKGHDGDKAKDGDDKYTSSKSKTGATKKIVVKRSNKVVKNSKYDDKYGDKPEDKHGDKPKDKPHAPPMRAVELTKTSAPAKTFVLCDVVVTKTANVEFTRTFDWTITKTVDSPTFNVAPNGSATATYTVTATKSAATDGAYKVTGSITVKNPYPTELPVAVTDQLASPGPLCAVAGPTTIPANGAASFSYACDLGNVPPANGAKNTATAAFSVNGVPMSASGSANVVVGQPTTVVNDSVTVTDVFQDESSAQGTSVSATKTTTYTRTLTGAPLPTCRAYLNVATIIGVNLIKDARVTVTVCETLPAGTTQQPPPTINPGVVPIGTPVAAPAPAPDLRVSKTGPAAAIAGQLVTYRINVTNRGTGDALDVVLRDVLPRSFSVFRNARGASVSKGAVRWSIGTLAPGQSRTVSATFRIDRSATGRRCNTAIATPSNGAVATGRRCTRIAAVAGVSRTPRVTG